MARGHSLGVDLSMRKVLRGQFFMDEKVEEEIEEDMQFWAGWQAVQSNIFWFYFMFKKRGGSSTGNYFFTVCGYLWTICIPSPLFSPCFFWACIKNKGLPSLLCQKQFSWSQRAKKIKWEQLLNFKSNNKNFFIAPFRVSNGLAYKLF